MKPSFSGIPHTFNQLTPYTTPPMPINRTTTVPFLAPGRLKKLYYDTPAPWHLGISLGYDAGPSVGRLLTFLPCRKAIPPLSTASMTSAPYRDYELHRLEHDRQRYSTTHLQSLSHSP